MESPRFYPEHDKSEAALGARETQMLRTLIIALVIGAPSLAMAQEAPNQFPESPLGQEVRGDDGTAIGRVTAVARNEQGNVEAVEIPGLEPADAPANELVAERSEGYIRVNDQIRGRTEVRRERVASAQIRIR